MFAGLLTLSACHNNDEPNDPDNITGKIYLAVRNAFEEGDVVITAKGDIIYQCAPKTRIQRFLVDGSDWYAVAHQWPDTGRDVDIVIKNGNIIYTTVESIYDLCIDDGNIYTLESSGLEHKQWLCKNFTHTYSPLLTDQFAASQIVVNHGDITLAPSTSNNACYWHNGEFIAIQGLEGGVDVCFIDKDGDDVLMGVNRDRYNKTGYWRSGNNYSHLNITDYIFQVKLVGGKSYILGMHHISYARNSQGVIVATSDAVVVIDGQEQVLRSTGNTNNYAKSMIHHNNDIYILVREFVTETTGNKSFIYKNMKPIKLDRDVTEREVIDFAIIGS